MFLAGREVEQCPRGHLTGVREDELFRDGLEQRTAVPYRDFWLNGYLIIGTLYSVVINGPIDLRGGPEDSGSLFDNLAISY